MSDLSPDGTSAPECGSSRLSSVSPDTFCADTLIMGHDRSSSYFLIINNLRIIRLGIFGVINASLETYKETRISMVACILVAKETVKGILGATFSMRFVQVLYNEEQLRL